MSYRTTVRGLLESLSSSRSVSGEFPAPDIELGAQVYHFAAPVIFDLTLTYAGAGIVAEGTATARVTTPCSRCLCDADLAVTADVDGFYILPGGEAGLSEEQEYEVIADDMTIDLEPAVTASLVLEMPFAPLHDEECRGICPVCGRDRNTDPCECTPLESDSPFAALGGLDLGESGDS